jgi:hypothetical protein
MKKKIVYFLIAMYGICIGQTQAALSAGDVAIIGIHTDATDAFAWVPLVNLQAGETIYFTDAGYIDGAWASGAFREDLIRYIAPSDIAAGTVQIVTDSQAQTGYSLHANTFMGARNSTDMNINFSAGGEELHVFQSTEDVSSGTFADNITGLFALDTAETSSSIQPFGSVSFSANATQLYPGLAEGTSAIGIYPHADNARYTGSFEGTREEILANIANEANWQSSSNPMGGAGWVDATGGSGFSVAIPEPSALGLMGIMMIAVYGVRRTFMI